MEVPSIVLAALSAVAGPGASVWVARIAAGRTLADLEKRIAALESSEPADVAKLRDDVAALAADLATLRKAVEDRTRTDDDRRTRAAENARSREKEQNDVITALRVELARLQERLNERTSALSERMEDRRGRR